MPRKGVIRLGRQVAGASFSSPNFVFKFAREADLPEFMARRIATTVSKFMYAAAQVYSEGHLRGPLTVEGAKLQHGAGHSSRVLGADGKSYLRGTEAAHFGIGTITRRGEALSEQAAREVQLLRATSGPSSGDDPARFGFNGLLTGYGLAHDASTYSVAAFINRTEGLQEAIKQPLMSRLLVGFIPTGLGAIERQLTATGVRVAEFLARDPGAVILPLTNRLDQLTRGGPGVKEFLQDRADTANFIYQGKESDLLACMREAHQTPGNSFAGRVDQIINSVPQKARDLAEYAEAAREERSAVSSSGATDSGSTSE